MQIERLDKYSYPATYIKVSDSSKIEVTPAVLTKNTEKGNDPFSGFLCFGGNTYMKLTTYIFIDHAR